MNRDTLLGVLADLFCGTRKRGGRIVSEHTRLGLLSLLLLAALGIAALALVNTLQAAHDFQQQNSATRAGDVTAIRPWMTIPVISHVYHVPEDYLDYALNIARSDVLHRATLYEIAARRRQPVDQLIHTLQQAILVYRKQHPHPSLPSRPLRLQVDHSVPAMGVNNP